MTDKLIPFTFRDTGVEVALKPVSNLLILEVRRTIPQPAPPLERVLNADGTFREEPNYDSPVYEARLANYNLALEEAVRKLCVKRGVVLRLNDEQKAEVAELREFMRAEYGIELDADDKYVYITGVALGTQADYQALVQAVINRPSDPKSANG